MKPPWQNFKREALFSAVLRQGGLWVLGQGLLILLFVTLPTKPLPLPHDFWPVQGRLHWLASLGCALTALIFLGRGLLDLGSNLTPFPYPRSEGTLVQTGIYRLIRHPLYSGLILLELAWCLFTLSWTHALAALALGSFLDQKANQEEEWLQEQYGEYAQYQERVKKLIPFVY
ncbi:methyltransferase family protein [Lyngbya confervoides]|uniref:Isoprenylcysteine carboxylmethyltransferase family protein n=1 Tax=Lyngbya confervoides BDU141951 TaxID=1574623 RepID=A0ABD4T1B8_9CYAN|nr:isoprenylcysteine carboxylmethyltransferase family protein [Lyngbya confervoides]MCM1982230.1 isoprenylcysteine carboxylmethyltransferase family protein [Lyngbya confervoides BDU141951]